MNWREQLSALVAGYNRLWFYAADPGAVSTLLPVSDEARRQNKFAGWITEGWAWESAAVPGAAPAEKISALPPAHHGDAVMMGQQVDFSRAHRRLHEIAARGFDTVFISDHWKDISGIFFTGAGTSLLPTRLLVPDVQARTLQMNSLTAAGFANADIKRSLDIFFHPGVEKGVEMVAAHSAPTLDRLREKYKLNGRTAVMFLDKVEPEEKSQFGFDWRSSLDLALIYMKETGAVDNLLVKPHPRQNFREVWEYLEPFRASGHVAPVTERRGETFIALCDEVWGMTTILLIIAQKAGRPIRAFMPDRTAEGAAQSNAHIEEFVIKNNTDFSVTYPKNLEKRAGLL